MPDNLMENLNPEQLKAVTHKNGPLLIVAGAGTGKTTVIAQKIAYAIEQGWTNSDGILALTFTEKAAGEMEERVDRLLPMGYLDLWISTFHGFAERIIKAHGIDIGLASDFKLLNEFEQWRLIKKNFDKFDLDYYRPAGNPTKFINALIRHFSRLKDEDISPKDYLEYAEGLKENLDSMMSGGASKKNTSAMLSIGKGKSRRSVSEIEVTTRTSGQKSGAIGEEFNEEIFRQEVMRVNEVANAYHVYQELLLDNEAMDFGDLINYCLKLFRERPAILEKYKKQFKYILVDEFQDTNWAQYELVKMLADGDNNLTVVGDDDQSIYRFRGASMSNILQFQKDYPGAEQIVLTKNYRNRQNILDLSYEFIKLNNPNRLEFQLAKKSVLNKKLIAQNKGEGAIEVIKGEDLDDEVRKVIEKIAELKTVDKKTSWNDFAILVRANDSAKEFCSALDVAGLPYLFLASRGLYAKPIILDVISYLKLLDDYHESKAMYRILNIPLFDFSYQELVNFNYWANKKSWSLYEVLRGAAGLNLGGNLIAKINKVLGMIEKHTSLARDKSVSEVFLAFLNDSGYLKHVSSLEDRESRESIGYLNQFMRRIKAFEASSDDRSVKSFLEELNMEISSGEEGSLAPDFESGPEAIKIMTVHGAKGLEFKHVFVANMVDKRFPTIKRSEQIVVPDTLVKEIIPEGDMHLEEERRLFYVAMTRAREGLYFSYAPDYGGTRKKKPSIFLSECSLVKEEKGTKMKKSGLDDELLKISAVTASKPGKTIIPLPAYFSYTQLAAFDNCPYQYRFAHILKIPRKGKYVFSFGQTMHLVLQKLFELVIERRGLGQTSLFAKPVKKNEAKIDLEEILKLYEDNWIDDWYESKKQKEEYRKKGKEILKNFYDQHKDNWPQVVSLEQGVNLKLEGQRIYGKVDRIDDLGGNEIRVVDYKTGRPKEEGKITLEDKEQLIIYKLAVEQATNQKARELQFYYLDNNSEINFSCEAKDIEVVKKKLVDKIRAIETACQNNEFPPAPGELCKYCDFSDICEFRKN